MTGKQHLFFSLTTSASLSLFGMITGTLPMEITPVTLIGGSLIGSLVPDIDSDTSTLGRKLPALSKLLNSIFDVLDFGKKYNAVHLSDGSSFENHRRYMHDIAVILPLAIFFTMKRPELFGFFFGYIGHIFLDGLTPMGIPFFYLFNKKMMRARFLRVPTRSFRAKLVTLGASVLFSAVLYTILPLM